MAVNFTQKLATYNTTSALIDAKYLDIQNSTDLTGITIADNDLFVIQDGASTGTANTGKVSAQKIRDYIGGTQITGITLSADTETADCTDSAGEVDFLITGGTNCASTSTANTITIDVPTATASVLGAASFASGDFDVATGAVSIKDNSITLAYMATLSAGDLIYGATSSGNPTALSAGSNADILTLASGVPTWAAPAATTWSITDGTNTNAAFATGESFVYTGGDSITATISGQSTATTTLTIDLDESVSIDTAITGTSGAKALWAACTDVISIGHSSGSVTILGDLQVSGDTITTSSEIIEIANNTLVLNSDLTGSYVDTGFVFEMGSSTANKVLLYDTVQGEGASDTTGRFVIGYNATADLSGFTYKADLMQVQVNGASTNNTDVPIGHMQYHNGEIWLRVEN